VFDCVLFARKKALKRPVSEPIRVSFDYDAAADDVDDGADDDGDDDDDDDDGAVAEGGDAENDDDCDSVIDVDVGGSVATLIAAAA
jgi:hypothetical protein